jgi:hypothetical protein
MLSDIGMGQAEFTPVETETSVIHLPDVARRNVSVDGKLRSGVDEDRVWSWKQEALPLGGGSSLTPFLINYAIQLVIS